MNTNSLITFDFETQAVRTVTGEDGEPWFVGMDVCRCLGIENHRDALGRLDDDERDDVGLTDAIGRVRSTICVNEPGLYALIIASRKPAAKKFKRWVTHEVLPAIRKTGRYEAPGATFGARNPGTDAISGRDARAYSSLLSQVRAIYGPIGADKVYRALPLPTVETEAEGLRNARRYGTGGDFPRTADKTEETLDGWLCLEHLMAQTMPSRDKARVGDVFALALKGDLGAKITLAQRNILVDPKGWSGHVAFPEASGFLDRMFAFTEWAVDWIDPLSLLPRARRVKMREFSSRRKKGVLVPSPYVAEACAAGKASGAERFTVINGDRGA